LTEKQEDTRIVLTKEQFAKVKARAEKEGVPRSEIVYGLLKKVLGGEKHMSEDEIWECDECGEEIPADADFCPYCGVEFAEDEEEEDEEEED